MDGELSRGEFDTVTLHPLAPGDGLPLLVVAASDEDAHRFETEFSAVVVRSLDEAGRVASALRPRAVLCCEATDAAFSFLESVNAEIRAVLGDYEQLRDMARRRPRGIKIVPRNVAPHRLHRLLDSRTRRETPSGLLERTLSRLADVHRMYVRKEDPRGIEVVSVVDGELDVERALEGWQPTDIDAFGLGRLDEGERLFRGEWNGSEAWLAWIPWQNEARVTAILKVGSADAPMEPDAAAAVHAVAVQSVRHLVMPEVPEEMMYHSEYQWVLGPSYVGPDRRLQDTPALSRHSMLGRRKAVPKLWPGMAFVDGLSKQSRRYLLLYLLCSSIDLVLTLIFIGGGVFREANGVLAWAVERPVLFSAIKTALAIAGFWFLCRFQLWKRALVARIAVGLYLVLLLYWAALLLRFVVT